MTGNDLKSLDSVLYRNLMLPKHYEGGNVQTDFGLFFELTLDRSLLFPLSLSLLSIESK